MPGEIVGLGAAVGAVGEVAQRVDDEERGLRVLRVLQPAVDIVAAQLLNGIAEYLVRAGDFLREPAEELRTHPFVLRTLTWECKRKHVESFLQYASVKSRYGTAGTLRLRVLAAQHYSGESIVALPTKGRLAAR